MPKPIVCLSAELSQYMEVFRPCFSKRQWKYFVIVLLGLIECEERRTMTGVLRTIGERVSLSGLSRFLNKWSWSSGEVAASWHQRFRQRMAVVVVNEHTRLRAMRPKRVGRPKATAPRGHPTGYLILDDSIHVKPKGRKMGGLGHHYANSEGRVVTGHCLFTGLYVLLGQREALWAPLPMQMYSQKAVCEQEDVPFRSKIDMAVEQINAFEPVAGTQTHLLIDSWYHCKRVRKTAQQRGWHVSGGLKSNRVMRLTDADGRREWPRLSDYLARLGPDDWQQVTLPSQQGGRTLYAHLVPTWIRKLGLTLLLITRTSLDAPLKQARFWGSNVLDQDLQTLVDTLAVRWEVETFFECTKDLLGSDHYQLMTAQGIIRFWTLIACLMAFLKEQRADADDPLLTCGDVRHRIQTEHRLNLLHWLYAQFQSGADPGQISGQLTLSSS